MRFLITLLVIGSANHAIGAERTKLAVLDMEARGVERSVADTLGDIVTVSLKNLYVFDVISKADVQQMLNFEESKQLVGCASNASCVAEIGGALGVAKVVTGSIGLVGTSYVINLALYDTKAAKVIERETRTVQGSLDKLVGETSSAARYLVRSLLESKQGALLVKVSESGAEIELDGKLVGLSPMPIMKLASGPHTLRVSKTGFITQARDISVDPRQASTLEIALLPSLELIAAYDRLAGGVRGAAIATAILGAAGIGTAFVLWFAYNDPRNIKHNQEVEAARASESISPADQTRLNARADDIRSMYVISPVVGIVGGVLAAASIVLFVVGPRPGVYDQYKTIDVEPPKISFRFSPMPSGGFAQATLSF